MIDLNIIMYFYCSHQSAISDMETSLVSNINITRLCEINSLLFKYPSILIITFETI